MRQIASAEPGELNDNQATELGYLREENESLRALLGDEEIEKISAGVIGRPTALPYDVLMIDKGEEDGIVEDAPVYAGEHTVIGFVAKVYNHSSLVALVSTPGFTSTAYIYGPNIYTTAVGIGGGVTRIHVPQGIEIEVGDPVVMPSLAKGVYGSISAVDSVPERPEQYGYVTTKLPINSLRAVAVGTRGLSVMDFEATQAVVDEAKRDFLMVDVPEGMLIDIGSSTSTATSSEEQLEDEDTATSTEEETALEETE